jgi:MFS family permease
LRHFVLLIVISTLCHTAASGTRVAASLFAIHLGESTFAVGMINGLYGFLPMLLAVSSGRLTDRAGARMPMMIGAAGMALGASLPYFWPNVIALYASTTLMGCGFMLYNIALQNVAGFMGKPEDRAMNFNLLSLGFSISNLLGPLFAGLGIDTFGHRYAFLGMALLPIIPVAILGLPLLKLPRGPAPASQTEKHRVWDLLRDRRLVWLFVLTTLLTTGWELFGFMIPVYGTSIGLSATAVGLVMSSFSAALIVIRLILPAFIKRVDPWVMIAATLVYAGVIFSLFPFAQSALWLGVLSFLLGLGLGCPQPLVVSLLHRHAPAGRVGEAIGFRQAMIYGSQCVMPVLFGAVSALVGVGIVFWVIALGMAGGGIAGRREREEPK